MALPQRYVEKDFYTEAEYLALEEDALYKSEYVNGEIRMMSGGTLKHSALAVNVSTELRIALRRRNCLVLSSDAKVHITSGSFRYPDVSVVCGPAQSYEQNETVLTNPLVVVEVLSDSTESKDRGEKLHEYQAIDSLQSYLLVDQHTPRVEQYARKDNGHWDYQAVQGLEGTVTIPALEVTLALADIYEGIDFGETRNG